MAQLGGAVQCKDQLGVVSRQLGSSSALIARLLRLMLISALVGSSRAA
jgi:hypothetical protein